MAAAAPVVFWIVNDSIAGCRRGLRGDARALLYQRYGPGRQADDGGPLERAGNCRRSGARDQRGFRRGKLSRRVCGRGTGADERGGGRGAEEAGGVSTGAGGKGGTGGGGGVQNEGS